MKVELLSRSRGVQFVYMSASAWSAYRLQYTLADRGNGDFLSSTDREGANGVNEVVTSSQEWWIID